MDNNANFRIAVYVGGTVERHSGFSQIASVGALAGMEDKNLDAFPISSGSTNENPIITLKNTNDYVFYKLWDGSLYFSDDNNVGRFCIGMTIPSQARLKNNKSPYTLLMALYHKFLEMGTTVTENGSRKFANVELDKNELFKNLDDYPIEPFSVRVEPMKGNVRGQLRLPPEQMEDFFRDAQYHEFVNYDTVEITTTGLNMFPNLVVPRPKSYQIVLNGQPANQFLQIGGVEEYMVGLDPTPDYVFEPLKISLSQLKASNDKTMATASGRTRVRLDEDGQRIVCTLTPIEKWFYKEIRKANGSDDGAYRFFRENLGSRFKICVNGQAWEEDRIKPSRVLSRHSDGRLELRGDFFTIEPAEIGDYRATVDAVRVERDPSNPTREKLVVYVKAEKVEKKQNKPANNEGQKRDGQGKEPVLLDKYRTLFIGFLIGLAVGIGGVLLWQYFSGRHSSKKTEKELKAKEKTAFQNLNMSDKTVLKVPKEAENCRNYLRNYSNDTIRVPKGEGQEEMIVGHFALPNKDHVRLAKSSLEKFVIDSIKARTEEDKLFFQCKEANQPADTALCNKYMEKYGIGEDHGFFREGQYIQEVESIKKDLLLDLQKSNEERNNEIRKEKEAKIKQQVLEMLVYYINHKDYDGYIKWVEKNNKDWHTEFNQNKKNRTLLKEQGMQFIGDVILNLMGVTGKKKVEYLKKQAKYNYIEGDNKKDVGVGTFTIKDKEELIKIGNFISNNLSK